MSSKKEGYIPRIIDDENDEYFDYTEHEVYEFLDYPNILTMFPVSELKDYCV